MIAGACAHTHTHTHTHIYIYIYKGDGVDTHARKSMIYLFILGRIILDTTYRSANLNVNNHANNLFLFIVDGPEF